MLYLHQCLLVWSPPIPVVVVAVVVVLVVAAAVVVAVVAVHVYKRKYTHLLNAISWMALTAFGSLYREVELRDLWKATSGTCTHSTTSIRELHAWKNRELS